jgi:hypothetical protein
MNGGDVVRQGGVRNLSNEDLIRLKIIIGGGEQRFVAVVFRGDATAPERLWVCVRGDQARPLMAAGRAVGVARTP